MVLHDEGRFRTCLQDRVRNLQHQVPATYQLVDGPVLGLLEDLLDPFWRLLTASVAELFLPTAARDVRRHLRLLSRLLRLLRLILSGREADEAAPEAAIAAATNAEAAVQAVVVMTSTSNGSLTRNRRGGSEADTVERWGDSVI